MKTKQQKRKAKQRGRIQLGHAISEGKGHNAIQQAARKAKINPKAARKLEKILK